MKRSIDVQSLVDSHERPFLVIDREYQVVAVNTAFEQAYGVDAAAAVGRHCFQVSHHSDRPCFEDGEDCPHRQVFDRAAAHSCLHMHRDSKGRHRLVRVTAHPLRSADGDLYLGESFHEIGVEEPTRRPNLRMVGRSPAFLRTLEQLNVAAQHDLPVLLEGETGTGKDLAAELVHRQSSRSAGPFLTLGCTAVPESLFESEVFGYVQGAFTGSSGSRQGLYEMATGGTLFLDEVGEMPQALQAKLLRVLETGEYRRVGGRKTLRADVRLVCATNRHLSQMVRQGRFRQDLYYRIACLDVQLPTLRERLEDVPDLAEALLARFSKTAEPQYRISAPAMALLQGYHYPGNIRELRNILYVAATRTSSGTIEAGHLASLVDAEPKEPPVAVPVVVPAEWQALGRQQQPAAVPAQASEPLRELESRHISRVLSECDGNRRKSADALGISERTLYRKLGRYGLV